MLVINDVDTASPAEKAGLRPGDTLLSINREPVNDLLELQFHSQDFPMRLAVQRGRRTLQVEINGRGQKPLGITPAPFRVRRCNNRCLFCFVDQMPKGFRPTLYIKDEDYRLSFLDGAYLCATNLREQDLAAIFKMGLSPLRISVHATDERVRRRLLGNPAAAPILPLLRRFAENRIAFHTQIVVCPGINDRAVLRQSIRDLMTLKPALASLSVVPLGLTRHRARLPRLTPVDRDSARAILAIVHAAQRRHTGVYASDELYIKAGLPLPPYRHYRDFPQYDNGVGMMRDFIHSVSRVAKTAPPAVRPRNFGILTGVSAFPFIKKLFALLSRRTGHRYRVIPVENRVLGRSVTVTGLLCGADLADSARTVDGKVTAFFIPPNCLNADGLTLDNWDLGQVSRETGRPVRVLRNFEALP
ncbi:MAG: DUF512 domain-containing protein [Fibrobacterota bacterium]